MIDYSSGVPLNRQVANAIRADITAGRYRPGVWLPSETQLAQMYDVGRDTVRDALALLRAEGRITTVRKRGSLVVGEPDRESYQVPPGARVITRMPTPDERRDLATSEELREFGGIPEGVPVFEVTPGPRKHKRVLRGDRVELAFKEAEPAD
ncbi:DNA-binding transcriptional regulator YhcF (GntR family) [Nonomuraea muscovyensis]|uniref:DNA-binding transcriptional regulator YhcF (GntR family) n=1 Tax=Nonomuraea muscovyensis TaxID=1124761 RepID=A0A7X0F2I5_9ACTN|nr:GntR family transcriptional regulator [Nonomuraea muscovyensis]MBB6351259.1 DNA-binding transcriptional regulator YhcF (GntR family) [Nonomuraea muscovyensis]